MIILFQAKEYIFLFAKKEKDPIENKERDFDDENSL